MVKAVEKMQQKKAEAEKSSAEGAARIDVIEKAIESMSGENASLKETVARLSSQVAHLTEKVRDSDPEVIAGVEARQVEVTDRLRKLINRITVVTEVCFYARHMADITLANRAELLSAATRALDYGDEWWDVGSHDEHTIEWWAVHCVQEYRAHLKEDAMRVNRLGG